MKFVFYLISDNIFVCINHKDRCKSDNKWCAQRIIEFTDKNSNRKYTLRTGLFISWITRWDRFLIRYSIYDELICRDLFVLNFVISGKVASLPKVIKYVKKKIENILFMISVQNIRWLMNFQFQNCMCMSDFNSCNAVDLKRNFLKRKLTLKYGGIKSSQDIHFVYSSLYLHM